MRRVRNKISPLKKLCQVPGMCNWDKGRLFKDDYKKQDNITLLHESGMTDLNGVRPNPREVRRMRKAGNSLGSHPCHKPLSFCSNFSKHITGSKVATHHVSLALQAMQNHRHQPPPAEQMNPWRA